MKPRRAILTDNSARREPLIFTNERWAKIRERVPPLPADADAMLRNGVAGCCSRYLTEQARLSKGQATAAALRRPGKRGLASFEAFTAALRKAADTWKTIGEIYDDQLSDFQQFDELERMAADAERRLAGLRALGEPKPTAAPWRHFVRILAACRT